MAASLKLLPGSTVRWRGRRYLIVDYESLDAIIARQPGKRRLERIPVNEAAPDHASHIVSAWTPDLASVPEEAWQKAVKRFKILKPLLNMGNSERTFAHIKKAARALGKHPATVYRWIENYGRSERLSVFLRKERSDRGARRLSNKVEKIIDAAIKKIYLTAERPDVAAVVEEVNLQCFNSKIKGKPAPNTIRARVSVLSDRLKLEKREGRKRAAEKYEPLKGHFPGADCPLAVAQIDHTPMDVIVVDEEHRQPIQRPSLTVVIDVYSRMVLGFAIYLEKPSAFTAGLAIAHAVLPKEHWLADVGVQAEWPCWGKLRKEFTRPPRMTSLVLPAELVTVKVSLTECPSDDVRARGSGDVGVLIMAPPNTRLLRLRAAQRRPGPAGQYRGNARPYSMLASRHVCRSRSRRTNYWRRFWRCSTTRRLDQLGL